MADRERQGIDQTLTKTIFEKVLGIN
jgi:hypothetical protein